MDMNNPTNIINTDTVEKTFTQEQVNAIIGERLAKEKSKADTALAEREQQFAEREQALANREAMLGLKEKLNEMGLPAELLPVLNVTDTAALDTALNALKAYVAEDMRLKGVIAQLDGAKVIKVPASRLPEKFGFMLAHPVATVAPTKLEDYRVHDNPPGISGSLVEGRICYDAFVLDNKKNAIYYQATT